MKLLYRPDLKSTARNLRIRLTDAEQTLWFYLRRKRIQGIQFFRQRPIGDYIVDFYAPVIGLVIEVDGGQHFELNGLERDACRTAFLAVQGLEVIRFDNLQVLRETQGVLNEIYRIVEHRKSPSVPLLQRGKCITKSAT